MDECDSQLLAAYMDGELDAAAKARVEEHLKSRVMCAQELELLKSASQLISSYDFQDITDEEITRIHDAVDEVADQRVWRIGGAMGLIAASVLIVSVAWLNVLSPRTQKNTVATAPAPAWERMAMSLRPELLPEDQNEIQIAAQWMLDALSGPKVEGL